MLIFGFHFQGIVPPFMYKRDILIEILIKKRKFSLRLIRLTVKISVTGIRIEK